MYLVCEFWRGLIVPRDWRASRRRVASKAAAIRARVCNAAHGDKFNGRQVGKAEHHARHPPPLN
jgi:hypothetical protein